MGYYRQFIREFSKIDAHLNRLKEAGHSFIWTDVCQPSFLDFKPALFGDEVMSFPRFDEKGKVFTVGIEASSYAIGACDKPQTKVERPIMFAR